MPQQFVVPQFIDVESKIFGPITMRQFVIILSSLFLEFIIYKLTDLSLFIVLSLFVVVGTVGIAFVKVNGLPVHDFLLNFIDRLKRPTVRVWDKNAEFVEQSKEDVATTVPTVEVFRRKSMQKSRLAELSLIIDTGGVYQGEEVLDLKNKKRK